MLKPKKLKIALLLFRCFPDSKGNKIKSKLLRWSGAKVGKDCELSSSIRIKGNFNLEIGNNVYIGHESFLMGPGKSSIILGDYSKLGTRTIVVTGSHRFSPDGNCIEKEGTSADIRIGKGAVCSTGTIILPGKTIGNMSHAAAGSVITHDVPEFSRVAGVPAKIIHQWEKP